jgi:hypothetical protein
MSGITVDTDKLEYVAGESAVVDGRVDNVIPGERVRIDFYNPAGNPISLGSQFTEPNEEGLYSFSGIFSPTVPTDAKPGEYTFLATYNKLNAEAKIVVKGSGTGP